jgi:UDP-2-acetamido-3-amino-2,3-dideoxy-glucuronate N-acetyltransferase
MFKEIGHTSFKIHLLADVNANCIGEGTIIWQYCVVLAGAIIGSNCNINSNVFIEDEVRIGNNVTVKSGVQLYNGIIVHDNVFIGPNATFTNDLVPRSKNYNKAYVPTLIERGASIGANCTVVAGVVIGEYSFIGAGSVITKDIPPYTVWYGNPARHRGYISADGILLNMDLQDKDGNAYIFRNCSPVLDD